MSDRSQLNHKLLRDLLRAITEEWGYETVRASLADMAPAGAAMPHENRARGEATSDKRASKRVLPSALAATVTTAAVHKELIVLLAERFEDKTFLPTSGDVRNFLAVHGGQLQSTINHRTEAFRKVLRVLTAMSEDALRDLAESRAFSGPARLAPLSDAIRQVGETRDDATRDIVKQEDSETSGKHLADDGHSSGA